MSKLIRIIKSYSKIEWLAFGVIASWNSWWPIWAHSLGAPLCYGLLLLLCIQLNNENRFKPHNLGICIVLFLYYVFFQFFNEIHLTSILIVLAFLASNCLNGKEGKNIISLLTSYLAISILISLPAWLFHRFISEFAPYQILDISDWKGNDGEYYLNYILFVAVEGMEANRFYSLFDEPGVLGTISAFVLWANNFNIKDKRCLAILIGSLFTYSMAFYVLSIIGWLSKSKFKISSILTVSLLLSVIGLTAYFLLKDDLAFQQSILYRFSNYNESGVDTRTTYQLNKLWAEFIKTPDLFLGLGSGATSKIAGNTSYRVFILEYGLIGLIIVLMGYFKNIRNVNWSSIITLGLFFISFLQRPALFSAENIIMFTCIVRKLETLNTSKYGNSRFL